MTTEVLRMNDSYLVRLPAIILDRVKVKENEEVQIFEESGRIVIQKTKPFTIANDTTRKTIDELFENFDGEYEPVEMGWTG